jgi:hypothetical protein
MTAQALAAATRSCDVDACTAPPWGEFISTAGGTFCLEHHAEQELGSWHAPLTPIDPLTPLGNSSLPTGSFDENVSVGVVSVGVGLGELDTAARARVRALGITAPLGDRFACVLPGHDDTGRVHPPRTAGRQWRYQCERATLGLAEVRAAIGYGRVRGRISGIEAALWWARLDHEAGLLQARAVLIALDSAVPDATRRVALGLQLYLGLRDPAKLGGEQSFTWARPFVMAWCGEPGLPPVTDQQAREAVWQLQRQGVLVPVPDPNGEVDERTGRLKIVKSGRANLYRAGVHLPGGTS